MTAESGRCSMGVSKSLRPCGYDVSKIRACCMPLVAFIWLRNSGGFNLHFQLIPEMDSSKGSKLQMMRNP
jgi:hypothetical protein